jgi:hypothetical protein
MFGRMMIEPLVQVDPGADLQSAMAALMKVTETVDPGSQERNLVRRGLRGRTIWWVQRKPARNAPEGL